MFSVPAVGEWDCDELRAFCWHYLADKTVVIINDADWENNHLVRNQSRLCRAQLARYGVYRVHIAAPEPFYEDRETKGVDDWLGAGGELEGLRVIETHPPTDRLHGMDRCHSAVGGTRPAGTSPCCGGLRRIPARLASCGHRSRR